MVIQYPHRLSFNSVTGDAGFTVNEYGDEIPNEATVLANEFSCRAETPKAYQVKSNDGQILDVSYIIYGPSEIPRIANGTVVSVIFEDGFVYQGAVKQMNKGQLGITLWV